MNNNTHKRTKIYKEIVYSLSFLSNVNTLKVGALITNTEGEIISVGYNTSPIFVNDPEDLYEITLHAEELALLKCKEEPYLLVCTHAPCLSCASKIFSTGVKEVWFINDYKNEKGIDFLTKAGIKILKL